MATQKLNTAELQPGMILGQSILDDMGRTIMQEGSRLTPMYIKHLQKRDIEEVVIVDEETLNKEKRSAAAQEVLQTASEEDRDYMRHIAQEVQQRFGDVSNNPIMAELRKLTIRHLVEHGRGVIPGKP